MLITIIAVVIAVGGAGVALAIVASDKSSHPSPAHSAHSTSVIVENASGASTSSGPATSANAGGSASTTGSAPAENSGQTTTTGTTSVKGSAASTSTPGPGTTIREHLEDLQNGDYQGAFELMSARYRGENPSWPTVRGAADPIVHIVDIGSPDYRSDAAHLYVDFYAQDSHPTMGSDTYCREFTGTVELISQDGAWRYNPYGDNLHSKLQPNSDCQS